MEGVKGMQMNVLFIVPRTHPNLSYLIEPMLSAGWGVTIATNKLTSDFEGVDGLQLVDWRQLKSHNQAAYDLCLVRFYPKGMRPVLASLRKSGCRVVQYDQAPLAGPMMRVPIELFRATNRIVRGRPSRRITPVFNGDVSASIVNKLCSSFVYPINPKNLARKAKENYIPLNLNLAWPTVVSVAKRGQPRKRIDVLLRAIQESGRPLNLVLISSGVQFLEGSGLLARFDEYKSAAYTKKIEELKRRLQTKINLIELEELSHSQTLSAIGQADLFVLPSIREPFAISPLEAVALGIPALVTSSNGSKDYVRPYERNRVVRPGAFSRGFLQELDKTRKIVANSEPEPVIISQEDWRRRESAWLDLMFKLCRAEKR